MFGVKLFKLPETWKGWGRENDNNKKVRRQTEGGTFKGEALARSHARFESGVD